MYIFYNKFFFLIFYFFKKNKKINKKNEEIFIYFDFIYLSIINLKYCYPSFGKSKWPLTSKG
jgi:hypothetical protein